MYNIEQRHETTKMCMDCIEDELDKGPYMPLRPEETLLLLVDPLPCFISALSARAQQQLSHKMEILCATAKQLDIPVVCPSSDKMGHVGV